MKTRNYSRITFLKALPFFIIFIVAILLRGQETFANNYLFLIDQGRDMLKVKEMIFDRHLTLIGPYTSLGGVFQGPLYYYLIAFPAILTRGDPIGPLALMLAISMLTIAVASFGMYTIFGYRVALVTSLLFAVSPEAIAAATYTWNPHPMWLLIALYAFFLFQSTQGHVKYNLLVWPTVALMFHFQMALGVFLFITTILYTLLFNRRKALNKYSLIGLCFAFLLFLPQIAFDFRHEFLMSKSILNLFSGKDMGLIVQGESRSYLALLDNHKGTFMNNYSSAFPTDGFLAHLPKALFLLAVFLIFFGRKIRLLDEKEHLFAATMAKIIILVMLLTLFYPFPFRYWFLTGFQAFYLLIAGLLLSKLLRNTIGSVILLTIFVFIALSAMTKLDSLYIHAPNDGGTAKIKGKKEAIDYIYEDASGEPFGLHVFTPPVNTDAYDYLIWWYGKKKYGYLPNKEKQGLFYLLIEEDPSQPWSYKGWLETVIKSGEILGTKTLPSGFIVQKRKGD